MSGIENVKFPAGSVVFKEGDQPDGVYFILSGGVEISKTEGGVKVSLAKLGPDAVFGEMALIDSNPRSATVMTLAETECMKGTTDNFKSLLTNLDPEVKKNMEELVTLIRDKNKLHKTNMSPQDTAALTALKQKAQQKKSQIMGNQSLLSKIGALDPFLNGVFNSLLRLLVS
jgi:CRP-like cAMP-binding protein